MTTAPVLEVAGVTKRFPGTLALDDVSFALRPGEVHALVGENGAGKSTLIKVLTGVYQPDGGELRHLGEPVTFSAPIDAQRAGISTIYQEVNLVPLMSVARNLFLGREPRTGAGCVDWARMYAEARELLKGYGITADVKRPLHTLGVGAQQMVALARAVSIDAKVVIMDEPTSSLEPREVETLFEVLNRLHAEGIAIVYVSHRLDELYRICDSVTVLRDGRVVHTGPLADLPRIELVSHDARPRDRADPRRGRHGVRRGTRRRARAACSRRKTCPACGSCTTSRVEHPARRGRRPRRPARLGPQRDGPGDRRRVPARRRQRACSAGKPLKRPSIAAARSGPGSRCCPRTARPRASSRTCRCARTSRSPRCPGSRGSAWSARRKHRRGRRDLHGPAADQGVQPGPEGRRPLRRQPAEGAARPLARHRARRSCCSTSPPAASTSAPRPRCRR